MQTPLIQRPKHWVIWGFRKLPFLLKIDFRISVHRLEVVSYPYPFDKEKTSELGGVFQETKKVNGQTVTCGDLCGLPKSSAT